MATTKNLKTAVPAAQRAKTPSPKEKLKVKTPATIKADDWYEAAFKRFSISQNRIDTRRDLLASLRPPAKPELQ